MIFDYPSPRATRRHGPARYLTVEAYRPWLRDEFTFRCVYCLKRETWGQVTGDFELDHFNPQSIAPHLAMNYFNLVYACRRCNSVKSNQSVATRLSTCHPSTLRLPLMANW
jgi:5-methylcytosine-specific restriction endonuclease McrA